MEFITGMAILFIKSEGKWHQIRMRTLRVARYTARQLTNDAFAMRIGPKPRYRVA